MNLNRHSGTPKAKQAGLFVCRRSTGDAPQGPPPGVWIDGSKRAMCAEVEVEP